MKRVQTCCSCKNSRDSSRLLLLLTRMECTRLSNLIPLHPASLSRKLAFDVISLPTSTSLYLPHTLSARVYSTGYNTSTYIQTTSHLNTMSAPTGQPRKNRGNRLGERRTKGDGDSSNYASEEGKFEFLDEYRSTLTYFSQRQTP